jgi:1,2-phenylacetyl-CoA epoxidase catalytic subunit
MNAGLDDLLRAWADDEILFATYLLGRSCAASPDLEKLLAMASIGQDEFGHADMLLNLLFPGPDRAQRDKERYFFERSPAEFQNCSLLKLELLDDWAAFVVRAFLYEEAEAVRLRRLAQSDTMAGVVSVMAREEKEHRRYWRWWLSALSRHPEARKRLGSAANMLSRYVSDVLWIRNAPAWWDSRLLRREWAEEVASFLLPLSLPYAEELVERMAVEPEPGPEVPAFVNFIEEQQRVYRSDPEAVTWG